MKIPVYLEKIIELSDPIYTFNEIMEQLIYTNILRTEEFYQCEDCSNCPYADKCKKGAGNRTIRMNEELTHIHKEVLGNLTSAQGLLLRANRSIQAEGTYGIIKRNRQYKRIRRRGLKSVNFEFTSICIGFNLCKYHLKKQKRLLAA